MSRLRLILFDVDGTLIDSVDHIKMAMDVAFDARGKTPPAKDAVRGIIGLSLIEAMTALGHGGDAEALTAAYKTAFSSIRETGQVSKLAPLFPGALAALDRLAEVDTYLLGVATGKSARGLRHVFAAHNLTDRFHTTQVADHHPSKPDPSMILAAMDQIGVDPADTVLVGDTSYDMEMAANAGVTGIGVSWGYHSMADLDKAGAKTILRDFADLDQCLVNIWGQP